MKRYIRVIISNTSSAYVLYEKFPADTGDNKICEYIEQKYIPSLFADSMNDSPIYSWADISKEEYRSFNI